MTRKPCPSDLTAAQWKLIAPLVPAVKPGGRPRKYAMREVVNALLYVNREGGSWRALPHDLPHWKTVYNFFRAFEADGTWDKLVAALRAEVRTKLGRAPPRAGRASTASRPRPRTAGRRWAPTGGSRCGGGSGTSSPTPWGCCWWCW